MGWRAHQLQGCPPHLTRPARPILETCLPGEGVSGRCVVAPGLSALSGTVSP